jgi:hypothetical protein
MLGTCLLATTRSKIRQEPPKNLYLLHTLNYARSTWVLRGANNGGWESEPAPRCNEPAFNPILGLALSRGLLHHILSLHQPPGNVYIGRWSLFATTSPLPRVRVHVPGACRCGYTHHHVCSTTTTQRGYLQQCTVLSVPLATDSV